MKSFEIITKDNCGRCGQLKNWFTQNKIIYKEVHIETQEIHTKLLNDPYFRNKFCSDEKCKFIVPLLHIKDSGEYFHKHLFGIDGVRTKFIKKILNIGEFENDKEKIIREPKLCRNNLVEKMLKEYILAVGICRSGGDLLYCIQIDKSINMDLITQFISALSMFGEENLGKIDRIIIKGLEVEMSIVSKHDLIFIVLFNSRMVQDYLDEESERGLDKFYEIFKVYIDQHKTNQALYDSFDTEMCLIIQNYLVRTGVLECVDCSLEIPILREVTPS